MSVKDYIFVFLIALAMNCPALCARTRLTVRSQSDFDRLPDIILSALDAGEKTVIVRIASGVYFYQDNFIVINKNYPGSSLAITGNGATLVAAGRKNPTGTVFPDRGYVSLDSGNVDVWSQLFQCSSLIEVQSAADKRCRIPLAGLNLPSSFREDAVYVQIPQWYLSPVYRIDRIDDDNIWFTANDLDEGYRTDWSVNNDYGYAHVYPRFRLAIPIKSSAFECEAVRFLSLGKFSELKNLTVSGLRFLGNAQDGERGLFDFLSSDCQCSVKKCTFEGIRSSRVISIGNANPVTVTKCCFIDCYHNCVKGSHDSEGLRVTGCDFNRCGIGLQNSFCVSCAGSNFYIADNTFEDFGYGGIGLGLWYKHNKTGDISGVAEHNMLSYSQEWLNNPAQHTLMDSGAIYAWTYNDNTVIRYNVVSGYSGMKDNRGIYCDDGAFNIQIYGNVVTGITNSYCIDSRRVARVEAESSIEKANINNVVRDNIVDGVCRFEGNEQSGNNCIKGHNYLLILKDGTAPEQKTSNIQDLADDVVLDHTGDGSLGRIGVSSHSLRQVRQSPEWSFLSRRIVRKGQE